MQPLPHMPDLPRRLLLRMAGGYSGGGNRRSDPAREPETEGKSGIRVKSKSIKDSSKI